MIRGEVFDVAVDVKLEMKTFKKYHGEILSEESKKRFIIHAGFAHSFIVLSDVAELCNKCDKFYRLKDETVMLGMTK